MAKIDRRSLDKLMKDIYDTKDKIIKLDKNINKKYKKEVKENLEYIARTAIDNYYESYSPNLYKRSFDLYNIYKVHVTDKEWEILYDSSYMNKTHRVDKDDSEYIYDWMFKLGWHGGAAYGPDHPSPGTPWWKLSGSWYKPAIQTGSPYKQIKAESEIYLDDAIIQKQEEFNDKSNAILDSLEQQIYKTIR